MKKTTQPLKALKIRLLRKPITLPSQDTNQPFACPSKFMVWGYYDWAIFENGSSTLHEFYRSNSPDIESITKDETLVYEEQALCGFTEEESILILNKQDRLPLFIITEIKLDDEYLNRAKQDIHSIKKRIEALFERHLLYNNKFQVFYSLGYSDLMVTSLCSSYRPVYDAIIDMRQSMGEELKSTYSIYGIDTERFDLWQEKDLHAVSIFMSLKTELSIQDLRQEIHRRLNQESEHFDITAYPIFGKYDVCIHIKPAIAGSVLDIAHLFFMQDASQAPLNEQSVFYQKGINYTRTHWYLEQAGVEDLPPAEGNHSHTQRPTTGVIDGDIQNSSDGQKQRIYSVEEKRKRFDLKWRAWQFIAQQSRDILGQDTEPSLTTALRHLLRFYWQVENNETINPQLCQELSKLFDMLLENTICSMGVDPGVIQAHFAGEAGALTGVKAKYVYETDSFELGIHLFSELLQNRMQATRMVLEGATYNFKFINASTKIYIAYHNIVESIEELINRQQKAPKLNFFTTMHHADEIKAILLFPDHSPARRIIPIRIDIRSFFSPRHSLPRIIHEIGHFVNPINAQKNLSICETVLNDIARHIIKSVLLEDKHEYLFSKVDDSWWYEPSGRIIDDLKIIIQHIVECNINEFEHPYEIEFSSFCELLKKALRYAFSTIDYEVEKEYNTFSDHLADCLASLSEGQGKHLEEAVTWLAEAIEGGEEIDMALNFCMDELAVFDSRQQNILKTDMDTLAASYRKRLNILNHIAGELSRIILDGVTEPMSLLAKLQESAKTNSERIHLAEYIFDKRLNENTRQNQEALQKKLLAALLKTDFSLVIDLYHSLYEETSADLFMMRVLALDANEYLQVFQAVINEKDQTVMLPSIDEHPMNIARLVILLRNFFPETATDRGKIKVPKEVGGLYEVALVKYLKNLDDDFMKYFIRHQPVQHLQEQYRCLRTAPLSLTNELYFFQNHWGMR